MYWYTATPRDDVARLIVPAHRIYRYKQWIKGIDQVLDSPQSMEELYKIGDLIWVKHQTDDVLLDSAEDVLMELSTPKLSGSMAYHTI